MAGKYNFITKAIGLVMDCEKMVGDQYDQGLANIITIVETRTNSQPSNRGATYNQ